MINTRQSEKEGEDIVEAPFETCPDPVVTASVPQRAGHPKVVDGTPVFDLASEVALWDTWDTMVCSRIGAIKSYMSHEAMIQELLSSLRVLTSIESKLAELHVCALRSNFKD
jgi:hypothetical protein